MDESRTWITMATDVESSCRNLLKYHYCIPCPRQHANVMQRTNPLVKYERGYARNLMRGAHAATRDSDWGILHRNDKSLTTTHLTTSDFHNRILYMACGSSFDVVSNQKCIISSSVVAHSMLQYVALWSTTSPKLFSHRSCLQNLSGGTSCMHQGRTSSLSRVIPPAVRVYTIYKDKNLRLASSFYDAKRWILRTMVVPDGSGTGRWWYGTAVIPATPHGHTNGSDSIHGHTKAKLVNIALK